MSSATDTSTVNDAQSPLPLPRFLPFALLALVVTLWFWPVTLAGRRPLGGEISSVYLPELAVYDRALSEGRLLVWNSNRDFGVPALAEGQVGILYPVHLVLHGFLDAWNALAVSMVFHHVLAAWFAYWCARGFGLSRTGAMLTGLVFVGQGFFVGHADQPWSVATGCWLPLAVLATWRWVNDGAWHWLLSLVLVLAIQLLAGHFQVAFFTIVTVLLLGIAAGCMASGRRRIVLARSALLPLGVVAALMLASVQLLPTAELVAQADLRGRGESYLGSFANPPLHLINYFAPTLFHQDSLWEPIVWTPWKSAANECLHYVGLLPMGLALWSLGAGRRDEKVRVWFVLLLFGIAFSLGPHLPGFRWLIAAPGFGWFTAAARWSIVSGLFLALLAGWGLDHIDLAGFGKWCWRFALAATIVVAVSTAVIVSHARTTARFNESPSQYSGLNRTLGILKSNYSLADLRTVTPASRIGGMLREELVLPGINLALLAAAAWFAKPLLVDRRRMIGVVLVWSLVDLSAMAYLMRPVKFVERRPLTETSPVLRLISEQDGPRVIGLTSRLPMAVNAAPLTPGTPDMDRYWDELTRSEAMDAWPGSLSTVPPLARWGDLGTRLGRVVPQGIHPDNVEFFRLSDIRFLICGYGSNVPTPQDGLRPVDIRDDPWLLKYVYGDDVRKMVLDVRPEATHWSLWEADGVTSARAWTFPVSDPPRPGTDPRALSRAPPARRGMLDRAQPLKQVSDNGDEVTITGSVDTPSVLVLSDLDYPGWQAELKRGPSTEQVEIEPAFGKWRSVYLAEPGSFELTFTYRPESFRMGGRISICSLLLWSICFATALWWRRTANQ